MSDFFLLHGRSLHPWARACQLLAPASPILRLVGTPAARYGFYTLDLCAVVAHDQMADVDDALVAGVGTQALKTGVVRLHSVVILGGWVRVGCARLCSVHWGPFPLGQVPGSGRLLRGHSFIRRPNLICFCFCLQPVLLLFCSCLV